MNQSSSTSSQETVKAPTTLDKIPEDVQLAIIKFIQSWKKSEGSEQEREKGKRARDSALRAVALSCRNLLSVYRPELLTNVTLDGKSLLTFYLGLARNRSFGRLIRSITFIGRDVQLTPEEKDEIQEVFSEMSKALRAQGVGSEETGTIKGIVEGFYLFLTDIQTLIIHRPEFSIPLQSKLANDRLAHLPFLTHSLKKLFISMWEGEKTNLKTRNVVWILVFCTGLRSVTLSCVFDEDDFPYLAEFSDAFRGLSQVQKLALGVTVSVDESVERYWETAVGKEWVGGNRRTQAIFYLLQVTRNLQCLEINSITSVAKVKATINSSCLSALQGSYLSLESLRLLGLGFNSRDPKECKANTSFTLFQKLKVLSMDAATIILLVKHLEIQLPNSLKVIFLPYYYSHMAIKENLVLSKFFKVRSFPSLEVVAIPSGPTFRNGIASDSESFRKQWLQEREELEKAEIFQSGKVELRLVEPGKFIGDSSETDFMSALTWISPP